MQIKLPSYIVDCSHWNCHAFRSWSYWLCHWVWDINVIIYIGPVTFVTWYSRKRLGIFFSCLAGVVWLRLAFAAGQNYSPPEILYWNTLLEFAYYILIVILVLKLSKSIHFEKQLARTDALSKIPNRLMFVEQLNNCFLFSEPFSIA